MEEEQEDADWGDPKSTPPAAPLKPVTSTSAHGPDPSSSTTWGLFEQPPQPTPTPPEEPPAAVEGEVTFQWGTSAHSAPPPT